MPTTAFTQTTAAALAQRCENAEKTANYADELDKLWEDTHFWNHRTPEKPYIPTNRSSEEIAELLLTCARLYGFSSVTKQNGQEIPKNFLTEANDIFSDLGLTEKQVFCSNYLALSEWQVGALSEAEIWLQNALSFHLPPLNPARLHTFIVESLVNCTNGKYEEILARLKKESVNFLNCDDPYLLGLFYMNKGIAEKCLGNFKSAEIDQTAAKDIFTKSGHQLLLAHSENNLGNIYRVIGDPAKAVKHINRALIVAKEINSIKLKAAAFDSLALIFYDQREYDIALKYATKAVLEIEKTECYAQRAAFCETKIKVLLQLKDKRKALLLYADTMAFARTYAPTACEALTATIEGFERKEIVAEPPIKQLNSFRLKFRVKPIGEYIVLRILTRDYIGFGLLNNSLAVIEKTEVVNGDCAVVREKETSDQYLGLLDISFGVVGLEIGNSLKVFNETDVEIRGKVIGHCPHPPDGEGYYQVVSFE